jgi:hypothetical protein
LRSFKKIFDACRQVPAGTLKMKTYSLSSSNLHSDGWRFFFLLIVCFAASILLSMMMQPQTLPYAGQDVLLRQAVQAANIAPPWRDEGVEELGRSVVINMNSI